MWNEFNQNYYFFTYKKLPILMVLEINSIKKPNPKIWTYFASNFKAVLCKMIIFMGNWWIIEKIAILFLKWVKKWPKFQNITYLEGIFITWNSKMSNRQIDNKSSILLCQAKYYVCNCFWYKLVQLSLVDKL